MKPITVFWDVDDVLNDLMKVWFVSYSKEKGIKLKYEQLISNPPHELLGITIHELCDSLDAFRLSRKFSEMQPVPEIYEWFEKNAEYTRNIALTATSIRTASSSSSWVFKHYSKWIRTYHIVPSPRRAEVIPAYDKNKIEAMTQLSKKGILIDDCEDNVRKAIVTGYKGLLFPRPWNSNSNMSIDEFMGKLNKRLKI